MALGVIPPLCATLGPVLASPEGCSRGRWRSGSSKWRHTAAPEGRVREHHAPVGALRLSGWAAACGELSQSGSTTHL